MAAAPAAPGGIGAASLSSYHSLIQLDSELEKYSPLFMGRSVPPTIAERVSLVVGKFDESKRRADSTGRASGDKDNLGGRSVIVEEKDRRESHLLARFVFCCCDFS